MALFLLFIIENPYSQVWRHYVSFYCWPICGMQLGGFFNFYTGKIQRGRPGV
jgi:hypothetical protein